MLTFVLIAIAIATFVGGLALDRRGVRRLALGLALGVPAQALIGGITVLTELNPWIVAVHLLVSMLIIQTLGLAGPPRSPFGPQRQRIPTQTCSL